MGLRRFVDEAFGVGEVGRVQDGLPLGQDCRGLAVMQCRGRQEADAGVVVSLVVPVEEVYGEGPGVLDGAEAGGKGWPVFHGAELAFRVRVVVGDVRAAVGLGHAEIAGEKGDWL